MFSPALAGWVLLFKFFACGMPRCGFAPLR